MSGGDGDLVEGLAIEDLRRLKAVLDRVVAFVEAVEAAGAFRVRCTVGRGAGGAALVVAMELPVELPGALPEGPAGDGDLPPLTDAADKVPGLREHLFALPGVWPWSLEADRELVRLSLMGWQAREIDLELELPHGSALRRFEKLTDGRRFKLADVAAALGVEVVPGGDAA